MNNKIPLKRLAEQLAIQTGMDNETAQAFLKSLFSFVTESLLDGQSVTIAGLGKFSVSHNTAEPVRFEPEKQFSDDVNAPFAMFEAVILPDNINVAEIDAVTSDEVAAPAETVPAEKPEETVEAKAEANAPEAKEATDETPAEPAPEEAAQPEPQTPAESEAAEEKMPEKDIAADISVTETVVAEQPVESIEQPCEGAEDDKSETEVAEDNVTAPVPEEEPKTVEEPETEETKESDEETVSEPVADEAQDETQEETQEETQAETQDETIDETQDVEPQGITYLPEVEEEYVDYHYQNKKSRFGLGFFLGLVTGLIIGALALVGYAVYFVKNGATLF